MQGSGNDVDRHEEDNDDTAGPSDYFQRTHAARTAASMRMLNDGGDNYEGGVLGERSVTKQRVPGRRWAPQWATDEGAAKDVANNPLEQSAKQKFFQTSTNQVTKAPS